MVGEILSEGSKAVAVKKLTPVVEKIEAEKKVCDCKVEKEEVKMLKSQISYLSSELKRERGEIDRMRFLLLKSVPNTPTGPYKDIEL